MKKIVIFTKIRAIVFNKILVKHKNKATKYKNSNRKIKSLNKSCN